MPNEIRKLEAGPHLLSGFLPRSVVSLWFTKSNRWETDQPRPNIYVCIIYSVSGLLHHKSFRAFRAASSILFSIPPYRCSLGRLRNLDLSCL